MSRVWLDPRNGSWWQVFLHEGGGSFPRLVIFVSENGDVLATPPQGATPPSDLADQRLCALLDQARDGLVRSAVRCAVSGDHDRGGSRSSGAPGGGRSVA